MLNTKKSPSRLIAMCCTGAVLALLTAPMAQAANETVTNMATAKPAAEAPTVLRVLQFSNGVEVIMSDGSMEVVRNGFYQHVAANGQLVEIRASTGADIARLLKM